MSTESKIEPSETQVETPVDESITAARLDAATLHSLSSHVNKIRESILAYSMALQHLDGCDTCEAARVKKDITSYMHVIRKTATRALKLLKDTHHET